MINNPAQGCVVGIIAGAILWVVFFGTIAVTVTLMKGMP